MLASYALAISHFCRSEAVVISTTYANRSPEMMGVVGYVVNVLPLLFRLPQEQTIEQLLAYVQVGSPDVDRFFLHGACRLTLHQFQSLLISSNWICNRLSSPEQLSMGACHLSQYMRL
jgi:hypothetical protein